MARRLAFLVILLSASLLGFSQDLEQDSIAPKKATVSPSLPIDSTFTTYNASPFDSIFLNTPKAVDTTTFHAADFDDLQSGHTIYSTLSNKGMPHKSMRFDHPHQAGFDMSLPAFSAFLLNEYNMASYLSVKPYSEIRYLMAVGDLEQHFHARFGRQFTPRLLISFAFDTDHNPPTFAHNNNANNAFWLNAKYITKNDRYGVGAYWYRNKFEMSENGGLINDEHYTSHSESDNAAIPVNLSDAVNFVVSSGIGFEQYFNLLPKKTTPAKKETSRVNNDSIAPLPYLNDSIRIDTLLMDSLAPEKAPEAKVRKFTLGRLCHSFSYLNNKLYYNEKSPGASFYQPYDTLFNNRKTTDTTLVRAIKNTLKWSSLGYQKYNDDIPFYLYAGVTHGFYTVKHYDYIEDETVLARNYNQLSVNGGIIVNLFKSTRITGQGELVTLGYQIGDFDVKGQWKQFIGTSSKNYGRATFNVELKRQSASWFEESYYSNHFRWDNDFHAATYLTFDLRYSYKTYGIGVKQTTINDLIYFGTDARPAQYDGMFSIREAYLNFYQKLGRFELEGFASLQKSSNEEVMHLPLALGQLKVGYSQPIFHKAATLHPSLTVRYFTKYYADAYMPATRTFYLQNEVEIGNYPFIDLALAIKVKKAHIYAAYSNMFLLTGNRDSFIAPHYPMRDSKIFIGVNWRLFN
jgi:hypothetical protein